jgi:hypothetical protein
MFPNIYQTKIVSLITREELSLTVDMFVCGYVMLCNGIMNYREKTDHSMKIMFIGLHVMYSLLLSYFNET